MSARTRRIVVVIALIAMLGTVLLASIGSLSTGSGG